MKVYLRLFAAILLFCSTELHAETWKDLRVTGTVVSAGEPVTGVTVRVKGTSLGTVTDMAGRYAIEVPSNGVLIFSFIGMETVEQPVNNKSAINVTMVDDSQQLDEVMVVAYATAKKYSFTGAASNVKGEDISKLQTSSISKALQGSVAGLQSTSASGQPGTDATIRIRGIGSINASSNPLYVLDGVPYDGNINAINPEDIASVTVLKDAASAALYGSRGANGVIIITTKQGKKDTKTVVAVKAMYGTSDRAVKDYEQVTTNQYFELYWEAIRNNRVFSGNTAEAAAAYASANLVTSLMGTGPNPYGTAYPQPVGPDGKIVAGATPLWNNSWIDACEQTAQRKDIGLNISGGGKTNQYYFSAGYLDDQGIALGSKYTRFNLRSNVTSEVNSWLKTGVNLGFTHSDQGYPLSSDSNTSNVINSPRLIPSFYPRYVMNEDGTYQTDNNNNPIPEFGSYRPAGAIPNWNLPATLPNDKADVMRDEVSARMFAEFTLLKELKFKTSYNFDLINYNAHDYTNPKLGPAADSGGEATRTNQRTFTWTFNNILTYDKSFGDHHFTALLGQEAYLYRYDHLLASRSMITIPDYPELVAGAVLADGTGYRNDYALTGYLSRLEYDYQSKYFLSGSYRRDGSSRFSPESRWGNFWSVGGSWRVDKESFMEPASDWLSALTLKASYGAQGNDNLGTYYANKGLYSISSNLGEGALTPSRLATPNLKWETNLNMNLGVEFALLNNRISGSFDFFQRQSKDLLYSRPLAPSMGYESISENVGAMKNVGFDIDLKGTIIDANDFVWKLGLNLTHYKNEVTELPLKDMPPVGTKKLEVGRSVYDFYLKEWAGVDPNNGSPLWYITDSEGNKKTTSKYSDATLYFANKSALPDLIGGFNTSLAYKGVELSAMFAYSIGGYILNRDVTMIMHNGSTAGRAWSKEMLNRWTHQDQVTDVPALSTTNTNWTSNSTRFLYDASYLRVKNVMLSYALPSKVLQPLKLSKVSVYVQGDNLFTFYKMDGMDPEQSIDGTTYFRYPAMKTLSGGINITF